MNDAFAFEDVFYQIILDFERVSRIEKKLQKLDFWQDRVFRGVCVNSDHGKLRFSRVSQ